MSMASRCRSAQKSKALLSTSVSARRLIQFAQELARSQGYPRLAVISAIGTRRYYQRLGFQHGELYMFMDLD